MSTVGDLPSGHTDTVNTPSASYRCAKCQGKTRPGSALGEGRQPGWIAGCEQNWVWRRGVWGSAQRIRSRQKNQRFFYFLSSFPERPLLMKGGGGHMEA